MLLPVQLVLAALWRARPALLRQWAQADPTSTLTDALDFVEGHEKLAAALGVLWAGLQLTALVFGSCLGCCLAGPQERRRRHPW